MAGTQTHGYDLVIEFAEQAVQDIVSAFFDADGLLSDLLSGIGAPASVANAFTVIVAFDRPTDVPSSDPDVVDIQLLLGEGGTGSLGHLRVVAGVDIEPTDHFDIARIDLENRLERTEFAVTSLSGTVNAGLNLLFRNALRDHVKSIPLVPIPVERTTTSTTLIKAGDVRIVDDTSGADKDAVGFLLTWGGGSAGNRTAFTQSFLDPGQRGGIAISFEWLCRVISPAIDSSLNLGGAFTDCHLTRTVRIDEDKEVDLTALSLEPDDDFIRVSATVTKSGFCYDASGTVSARIRMAVDDGVLSVTVEVDDPHVDVDIPWYCWLAGAVIGAIVAGVIGAVLVPIIIYIAQESVEGTINSVAARVADAINSINLNATIPMPGVRIFFQRVFIDDIDIACDIIVTDNVPVRSEGVVTLTPGTAVDLDTGQVGPADLGGADVACTGAGFDRQLRAVCGARLARTGLHRIDGITRSALYRFTYDAPNPVALLELARLNPFGVLFGDPFDETDIVIAVHTNEGRYAVVQAVEVDNASIRLRYRTWEKRVETLQITGDFQCEGAFDVTPRDVRFTPSAMLSGVSPRKLRSPDLRIGTWEGIGVHRTHPVGRFDAVTQGISPDAPVHWALDGHGLTDGTGDIAVSGATVHYELTGRRLLLSPKSDKAIELLLEATVVDQDAEALTTRRCVHYNPICRTGGVRYIPPFNEYLDAYLTHFGVVEVDRPVVSQGGGGGTGGQGEPSAGGSSYFQT